jgi:hypothetical protein
MIERAYRLGEALGLAVWGMDEAGPYTTTPYPGTSWQLQSHPKRYPHEYPRNGTAKMLTLLSVNWVKTPTFQVGRFQRPLEFVGGFLNYRDPAYSAKGGV